LLANTLRFLSCNINMKRFWVAQEITRNPKPSPTLELQLMDPSVPLAMVPRNPRAFQKEPQKPPSHLSAIKKEACKASHLHGHKARLKGQTQFLHVGVTGWAELVCWRGKRLLLISYVSNNTLYKPWKYALIYPHHSLVRLVSLTTPYERQETVPASTSKSQQVVVPGFKPRSTWLQSFPCGTLYLSYNSIPLHTGFPILLSTSSSENKMFQCPPPLERRVTSQVRNVQQLTAPRGDILPDQ
jgi:hypothetical protein